MRVLAAVALLAAAQAGLAQGWPARPVKLIAPYAAGVPIDVSARILAARLQEALGQPVVVENKPGAGGNLGADFVAKSAPDGYTLVMGAIATHAINPSLMGAIPLRPDQGKGSAPAVTDLLAGRLQLMFDNLASSLPNIKAAKVRALAVTTMKRSSFLPDLPTLDESGLKGFDMTTWWGVMAQFTAFVDSERSLYARLVRQSGAKAE
jgi:tripartite-type tricarboxylate transporter receptor subunit TctC